MSDDSYGRVTNPERYQPLHDAARSLIDQLIAEYDVEVDRSAGDVGLAPAFEVVRLTPRHPEAAPLAIGFTDFPGIAARFGNWHLEYFPHCGCDHCDESPAALIDEIRRLVTTLAFGEFGEEVTDTWLRHRFGTSQRGEQRLEAPDQFGPPKRYDWVAWTRRT